LANTGSQLRRTPTTTPESDAAISPWSIGNPRRNTKDEAIKPRSTAKGSLNMANTYASSMTEICEGMTADNP
jgi:hypothetical protein